MARTFTEKRFHTLYRAYGAVGALLYVGITCDLTARLASHRSDKPWWVDVAVLRLEHHPDKDSALRAEEAAIRLERPLYNVVHNSNRVKKRMPNGLRYDEPDRRAVGVAAKAFRQFRLNRDVFDSWETNHISPREATWARRLIEAVRGVDSYNDSCGCKIAKAKRESEYVW